MVPFAQRSATNAVAPRSKARPNSNFARSVHFSVKTRVMVPNTERYGCRSERNPHSVTALQEQGVTDLQAQEYC